MTSYNLHFTVLQKVTKFYEPEFSSPHSNLTLHLVFTLLHKRLRPLTYVQILPSKVTRQMKIYTILKSFILQFCFFIENLHKVYRFAI